MVKLGAIYRCTVDGNDYEVTSVDEHDFDRDLTQVGVEPVSEGTPARHYLDKFEQMYERKQGDTHPLSESEKEEIADRAREDWSQLAREFGVNQDGIKQIVREYRD